MTIRIPDDLTPGLEGIAEAQKKSIEQVAVECLRAFFNKETAPAAVLQTVRRLKHPSSSAVDDLDAAIAAARLRVGENGAFDNWPRG